MTLRSAAYTAKTATVLRSSKATFTELQAHERLAPEHLAELQDVRARRQALFAMQHTAFYRDLYRDAGITAADLRDPEAFTHLPVVGKQDVRDHGTAFLSDEANRRTSTPVATGGSTGAPLTLHRDLRVRARAFEWRLQSWWGVQPFDDTAIVYRHFRTTTGTVGQRLLWWPSRRFQLDARAMTDDAVDAFLDTFRRVRPPFLIGYVGALVELSRTILRAGAEVPAPVAIAVTAAPLVPAQRAMIERAFGAPVYDHYRCAEFSWMAGECEHRDGLHTFDDIRRVEVLDDQEVPCPAGVTGDVVVTDLTNRVFPLVRYRLGDRTSVIDGPCACGRPFGRIRPVSGRVSDAFLLPGGRVVAGESLTGIFSTLAHAVQQFQIHQHADHSVTVRCVPTSAPDATSAIRRKVDEIRTIVGPDVEVRLDLVEDIPHDGGKVRFILSDVPRSTALT